MSVLNLGLQGVATLARQGMTDEYEKEFKKCNRMSAVRKVAEDFERAPTVVVSTNVVHEEITTVVTEATGIKLPNQTGDDELLLAEGRYIEIEVGARSKITAIKENDGLAAANQNGDDEKFLAKGRDT